MFIKYFSYDFSKLFLSQKDLHFRVFDRQSMKSSKSSSSTSSSSLCSLTMSSEVFFCIISSFFISRSLISFQRFLKSLKEKQKVQMKSSHLFHNCSPQILLIFIIKVLVLAKQVNINLHLVINFINISLHINNFIFFLHNGFRNLMNVKVVAYL